MSEPYNHSVNLEEAARSNGYWVRQMRQPPQVPPFFELSRGPPFKNGVCSFRLFCGILKWFLGLTTVKVQTISGYFAFDCILPLEAILPYNVCVSSKLAYLLQCS